MLVGEGGLIRLPVKYYSVQSVIKFMACSLFYVFMYIRD